MSTGRYDESKSSSQQDRMQQPRAPTTNHRIHRQKIRKRNRHQTRSTASWNPQRKMQKWERKTIKTERERQTDDDTIKDGESFITLVRSGSTVKTDFLLLEERTPGCEGSRGESHYHIQAWRLNQPIWQQIAWRVERDTLEE